MRTSQQPGYVENWVSQRPGSFWVTCLCGARWCKQNDWRSQQRNIRKKKKKSSQHQQRITHRQHGHWKLNVVMKLVIFFVYFYYHADKSKTQFLTDSVFEGLFYKLLCSLLFQQFFSSQSSKHCFSQTVRAKELTFWDNVHPPPCVTCHMSCVKCHKKQFFFLTK